MYLKRTTLNSKALKNSMFWTYQPSSMDTVKYCVLDHFVNFLRHVRGI